MRKLNSQFITTFLSEAGLDGQNGTYYGFVEMDQYYCMAVAEGYDGDGGSESAKLAVDAAIEAFVQKPGITAGKIRSCLKKAHQCLKEHSIRIRLKAGILILVSDYTRFRYGVCGNVMLYGFRNAGLFHQSITHTMYQTMADKRQTLGEETGPKEETRNLYHYLGGSKHVTISKKVRLEEGDVLFAATEGFWNRINRVEILDAYESIQSVEEFLEDLQELYLRGSTEDLPCCCLAAVEIKKAYQENTALKKKIWIWCLITLLVLAACGTALSFYIRGKRRRQREICNTIAVYEDTGDQYLANRNSLLAKQEYEKASEESKKLDKNEERLERERLLSEKIRMTVLIDQADKDYESRNYTQARDEYKRALELAQKYEELAPLRNSIEQKQKMVSTGMEIDNYMESASLKEAAGDMENAGILYKRAEAMLRIVDDPERLKEVQLALLRVKEQADQEIREERAKARDEVIIDADKTAALSAVLAGDFETALEQYTKIRDSYIAMEENEKAEETTQIILSLQKQAREIEELTAETIDEEKSQALAALAKGDVETALMLYEKVQEAYVEMGDEASAQEMGALIESLQEQMDSVQDMEEPEPSFESSAPQETQPAAGPKGPSVPPGAGLPDAPGQEERQILLDQMMEGLLNEMLHSIARKDFASAIEACQEMEMLSAEYGDSETVVGTEEIIEGLKKLMEEANGGPGGN